MFEDRDPQFARFKERGRVHVLRGDLTPLGHTADDKPAEVSAVQVLLAKQTGLCGIMGEPGKLYGVSEFHDDDLCRRCWDLVPSDESHRLFEHLTGRPLLGRDGGLMGLRQDIEIMLTTEHRNGAEIIDAWSRLKGIERDESAEQMRAWSDRVNFDPEAFQQQVDQAMLDEGFVLPSEIERG